MVVGGYSFPRSGCALGASKYPTRVDGSAKRSGAKWVQDYCGVSRFWARRSPPWLGAGRVVLQREIHRSASPSQRSWWRWASRLVRCRWRQRGRSAGQSTAPSPGSTATGIIGGGKHPHCWVIGAGTWCCYFHGCWPSDLRRGSLRLAKDEASRTRAPSRSAEAEPSAYSLSFSHRGFILSRRSKWWGLFH